MKATPHRMLTACFLTVVLLVVWGCAGWTVSVRTEGVKDTAVISGRYTLILFNDVTYVGLRTAAFLLAERSGYSITPYAPSYTYSLTYGMSGQEALQAAISFVQKNATFLRAEVSSIMDSSGRIIGYEVRPLFQAIQWGTEDVMSITYVLKAQGTIEVHIDMLDGVQNELSAQGIL